jgi:hypothetical protein
MTIVLALVLEEDGRCTKEVLPDTKESVETRATTISKKVDTSTDTKKSFEDKGYIYNVLVAGGVVYLCVSPTSDPTKQGICFAFLKAIQQEYEGRGYKDKESISEYSKFVADQMDEYSNHPERIDKLAKVQKQADEVADIIKDDINKLLERQDRLENVQEATGRLQENASTFQHATQKLKCLERRNNIFWTIVCVACCLVLLLVIVCVILVIVLPVTLS